ncbi:hypothetical protein PIB30_057541 [Stylosanthes scabra]|uniref:Uncharacterized protein n=1 Tax=Stylosanthes scabra TaxID=79078 RepID=A0ABU6UK59_9FABA|nr:hypothetical protein [Stylosanthes scabra]
MLAKSLVDITAMLKEIKEGQQVTPMLLKRQTDHSQQNSIKYCRVCSCNSHHTDECPQLQEDNLVASTHNFYSATAIPPYNKQYYTQGWKDEQQNQWSSPQQNQPRQPYNPPRNNQNTRYQPPHNRQQYPPRSNQQMSEDEIFRALQQGNQETKEFNRQAMIQLNQVAELLHKMLSQQAQPLPKPPTNIPNPLPSQPLPNPKGGLNALNDKLESEEEAATTNNKEAVDYKEEEVEEGKLAKGWGSDTETQSLQGEMLSINTISDKKKDEEELPIKCEDQGPCLVTCRIKGFEIPGYVFTTADCSIVSAAGIIEDVMVKVGRLVIPTDFHVIQPSLGERGHPQVLLGRPFLKTSGFRLTYADDIFTFSSGRITETFQISPPQNKNNRQDDGRMRGKEAAQIGMIEALIRELLPKMREEEGLGKIEKEKKSKEKCEVEQKSFKKGEGKSRMDCLSVTEMLNEMEQILYHDKGADAHLVRNNSK